MKCLAAPCQRQRGAVTNFLTSTTPLLPAQVHLKNFAKPDILPYSVVGEEKASWNHLLDYLLLIVF